MRFPDGKASKIDRKRIGKIIKKLGFEFSHQTGSHLVYKHFDGRKTTIPFHSGEEIGPGLLGKIIKKDLQMTRKEFEKMLMK